MIIQDKIYVDELDKDSDLIQLGDIVIQRSVHLSEKWRNEVIDALYDLQSNLSSKKKAKIATSTIQSESNIDDTVCRILESTYRNDFDKLSGLELLLHICKDQRHLATVISHRSCMPALSRILHDDCNDNIATITIVIQIISSFSIFIDFHPELINNHIGSSIMTLMKNKVSLTVEGSVQNKLTDVIEASMTVLDHLSDDPSVCRKMLRKGLVSLLSEYLHNNMDSERLLRIISNLLLKASVYEDLILISSRDRSWINLLHLMNVRDEVVERNALMIFYNMSFFERFHQCAPIDDLIKDLFQISHQSRNLYECLRLLHRITKSSKSCVALATSVHIDHVLGLFLQLDRPRKCDMDICATVVKLCSESRCVELIMHRVGDIISLLQRKINSKLLRSICAILYQLSSWTRWLQHAISKACQMADVALLVPYVNDPITFMRSSVLEGCDSAQFTSIYQYKQYWANHVVTIIKIARAHLHDDCLNDLLGTIANMTEQDLPQGCNWNDMYCKHELLDLLLGITYREETRNDVLLEVAALYRQSCTDEDTASLLSGTRILSVLHRIWDTSTEDSRSHLHLLQTIQTLLHFDSSRNLILSDNDLFEVIFKCLSTTNDQVYQEAERCIQLIRFLDKDENGRYGGKAQRARTRYFEFYNRKWLESIKPLVKSPVIKKAEG